jgi:hypothetical protein
MRPRSSPRRAVVSPSGASAASERSPPVRSSRPGGLGLLGKTWRSERAPSALRVTVDGLVVDRELLAWRRDRLAGRPCLIGRRVRVRGRDRGPAGGAEARDPDRSVETTGSTGSVSCARADDPPQPPGHAVADRPSPTSEYRDPTGAACRRTPHQAGRAIPSSGGRLGPELAQAFPLTLIPGAVRLGGVAAPVAAAHRLAPDGRHRRTLLERGVVMEIALGCIPSRWGRGAAPARRARR